MSAKSASFGGWIPLMDYAMKKGVSLSTLRRYIKANKIRFKTEQGRYLIWDEDFSQEASPTQASAGHGLEGTRDEGARRRIEELEGKLRQAQEEIAELKMLVALYEDQLFPKSSARI